MLDGSDAGEAWDVLAQLDDGSRFSARFWVTNEGPGEHTGVAMGYFVRADGEIFRFRYGRTRDEWQLAAAGRYLKVASAVLDLRSPSGMVQIDTDKGGIKVTLRFAMPEAPAAICGRRADGSGFDVLRLQQKAKGSAWVDGMDAAADVRGTIDIVHAWGEDSEIDTVLRRVDASGRDGERAFFATTAVSPRNRGAATSCVAVVADDGPIYQATEAAVEIATSTLRGSEDDYPVPSRLVFRTDRLGLTVEPQREVLRVDPLEVVPQPFRLLLGLRSSPRRVWAEARWHLTLNQPQGGDALEASDGGLVAVSYTNPW
jgi:hypothetical protein